MTARLPWVLAALALGLALCVALLRPGEERSAAAPTRAVLAADAPRSDAALRDVDALAPVDPASARAPARVEAPAPDLAAQPGGDAASERLIVRGTVSGPGVDPGRVEVSLARVGWPASHPVLGACDARGRYQIDAGALLDPALARLQRVAFELVVSHPDCLHERRRIVLQREVSPEAQSGAHYVAWAEGTTVCELDVELTPAAEVRGVIVGVDDPLDFAVVATRLEDGVPRRNWLAHATPDAQGRFTLRLAPLQSYAVVAAARDLRPTTARVDLGGPGPRDLVLRPEPGAELSGRVRMAPGFGAQELGVELQFARGGGSEPLLRWPRPAATLDELVWLDGAFEWRLRSRRTHDGGRFAFTGLAPREYELRALGVGVPGEELRAWPVARLRAPARDLALGPVLASLDLDLGPLPDGPIAFELFDEEGRTGLGLGPYRTDAGGRAQVHLPPGRSWSVMVEGEAVGRIASPAAGEVARFALAR